MSIEASVIIPAFNRVHQVKLTLASLENQTYPLDRFEVVIVNDGSSDELEQFIKDYQAESPFPLIYTSTKKQRGRAATRNQGVKHSNGPILIFCDSDFVVFPTFIETFINGHDSKENVSLSVVPESWIGAYTHYYPEFSSWEKDMMKTRLTPYELWKNSFLRSSEIISIVTPEDIRERNYQKLRLVSDWLLHEEVKEECKKTDVAPWMLFITRGVSVGKKYFLRAGGFNEEFFHYGLEDWELGYRLSKIGVEFRSIDNTVGYHQEHPISFRGVDGNAENLKKIFKRHGLSDPEICMMALHHPWKDIYGYKNSLRKIKEQTSHIISKPLLAKKNHDQIIRLKTNETLHLDTPNPADNQVPFYYWDYHPTFETDQFTKSVTHSHIGETDCMWLNEIPYGGWGEPSGLIFYLSTFKLDKPTHIHFFLHFADDAAIVYLDGKPIAYKGGYFERGIVENGYDLPPENGTLFLEKGKHTVVIEAVNAYYDNSANRAGVGFTLIDWTGGTKLVSTSNINQWSSTGYVKLPPKGTYQTTGKYHVLLQSIFLDQNNVSVKKHLQIQVD
ncbi:glycosyltransferase involved in cell wall biosynthesis [Neobacillus niacini]|uniref:glycosyltransferase family 2 protein n=1 Tax=Neobacillus niacini TaxID=86668 RepID=UPI00285F76C7|nr:glycosyltransferase family 2 protein [Neobacillus niacini]MDR7078524.1 glycosyltransferase involved in cell wall biosynthesis [Neobacillus niacini]